MSKGLKALETLFNDIENASVDLARADLEEYKIIEKELKALEILIKWYQPDIIHDLCCFGASDEEIELVREVLLR